MCPFNVKFFIVHIWRSKSYTHISLSVPDSGLFQWTDASMWIIVTGEKSDDQVV